MIRRTSRFGYTLIELAVVLTVSSALIVMAAGWIQRSLKFGSLIRTRQNHHQNLLRLASLLREDVHRGRAMEMINEHELSIDLGDGEQVLYSITPAKVARVIRRSDAMSTRDEFKLARTTTVGWETSELPTTIELVVNRGDGHPGPDPTYDSNAEQPVDLYLRVSVDRWKSPDDREETVDKAEDDAAPRRDPDAEVDP